MTLAVGRMPSSCKDSPCIHQCVTWSPANTAHYQHPYIKGMTTAHTWPPNPVKIRTRLQSRRHFCWAPTFWCLAMALPLSRANTRTSPGRSTPWVDCMWHLQWDQELKQKFIDIHLSSILHTHQQRVVNIQLTPLRIVSWENGFLCPPPRKILLLFMLLKMMHLITPLS